MPWVVVHPLVPIKKKTSTGELDRRWIHLQAAVAVTLRISSRRSSASNRFKSRPSSASWMDGLRDLAGLRAAHAKLH